MLMFSFCWWILLRHQSCSVKGHNLGLAKISLNHMRLHWTKATLCRNTTCDHMGQQITGELMSQPKCSSSEQSSVTRRAVDHPVITIITGSRQRSRLTRPRVFRSGIATQSGYKLFLVLLQERGFPWMLARFVPFQCIFPLS